MFVTLMQSRTQDDFNADFNLARTQGFCAYCYQVNWIFTYYIVDLGKGG
jgi:hypothetical protein